MCNKNHCCLVTGINENMMYYASEVPVNLLERGNCFQASILTYLCSFKMKSIVCLSLAAVLIVIISGVTSKESSAGSNRRVARGFRLGAADRFSHGFGKRAEGSLSEYLNDFASE
jgi:hypothetical protein